MSALPLEGDIHPRWLAQTSLLTSFHFQLLDQEIACDEVATIDDVLALIRAYVSIASGWSAANCC
jgi:hypothetical protein